MKLLQEITNRPMAMHEGYLQTCVNVLLARAMQKGHVKSVDLFDEEDEAIARAKVWGQRPHHQRPAAELAREARASSGGYVLRGSVAMIPVAGFLAKHSSQVNSESGARGTSYEQLRSAMDNAVRDDSVRSVLFVIDSGGGSVDGLEEFALHLHAARKAGEEGRGPRMYSFIDGFGCSAAYYIASQTQQVAMSPGGEAGSLGTVAVFQDWSKFYEDAGVKVHVVRTGAKKAIGVEGAPIGAADLEHLQNWINDYGTLFKNALVRGRASLKGSIEQIFTGETWVDKKTMDVGLVDFIQSLDSWVSKLNQKHGPRNVRGMHDESAVLATSGRVRIAMGTTGVRAGVRVNDAEGGSMKTARMLLAGLALGATAMNLSPTGEGGGGTAVHDPKAESGNDIVVTAEQLQGMIKKEVDAIVAPLKADKAAADKLARDNARAARVKLASDQAKAKGILDATMEKALADSLADANAKDTHPDTLGMACVSMIMDKQAPLHTGLGIEVGSEGRERFAKAVGTELIARYNPEVKAAINGNLPKDRADAVLAAAGFASSETARKALAEAESNGIRGMKLSDIAEDSIQPSKLAEYKMAKRAGGNKAMYMLSGVGAYVGVSDFPNIMDNLANKSLAVAYASVPTTWRNFCRTRPLTDFKDATVIQLSLTTRLKETPEFGKPELISMSERAVKIRAKKYTGQVGISFEAIRNDDLAAFVAMPRMIGEAAAFEPEYQVYAMINGNTPWIDGQPFFRTQNNNVLSAAALSPASAEDAYEAFFGTRDHNAKDPQFILRAADRVIVPHTLWGVAQRLYKSEKDYTQTGVGDAAINTMYGILQPIASPLMSALNGGSDTAWIVAGNPSTQPLIEVGFLDGSEQPVIERRPDSDIFSEGWNIMHAFGTQWVAIENAKRSAGA